MSEIKMRVEIPSNPSDLLALAGQNYQKHLADGAASPLLAIKANNWTEEGPRIERCKALDKEANELKKKLDAIYKDRDNLLIGIEKTVKATRDVLEGINHDNPKRLADWGFTVIESVKPGPKKKV